MIVLVTESATLVELVGMDRPPPELVGAPLTALPAMVEFVMATVEGPADEGRYPRSRRRRS